MIAALHDYLARKAREQKESQGLISGSPSQGSGRPPQPVLQDFHNIECRDAVLDYAGVEFVSDDTGRPLTRWDGKTFKTHPLTGTGAR